MQHKSSPNDFLLVRSKATKEGIAAGKEKWTYHVREISSLYVVGQHTPKHEVYTPNRKSFKKFQGDYVRFWLEKLFRYARTLDNGQKGIELREAEQLFPSLNLTTLKKCMRTIAVAKKKSNFWERKKGMFAMKNVTFSCPHSLFEHSYRYQ